MRNLNFQLRKDLKLQKINKIYKKNNNKLKIIIIQKIYSNNKYPITRKNYCPKNSYKNLKQKNKLNKQLQK